MAVFIKHLKNYFSADGIFSKREYTQDWGNIAGSSFLENRKSYTGYYIDIGTHHPYPFSNPLRFSQKGWQKVIIEPALGSANLFNLLSEAGINLNTIQGAAPDRSPFSHFKTVKTNNSPAESLTRPFTIAKIINVREIPLTIILNNNLPAGQTLDFLSLDVAGFDIRALKSLSRNRYSPSFIIVKVAPGTKSSLASICSFLVQKNYEYVAQTDRALFFKYNGN